MAFRPSVRLPLVALAGLSLAAGVGGFAGAVPSAYAATTTMTVTNCGNDSQLQADVSAANSTSGDTIAFACSGDIPLTAPLAISADMTLDGSGHRVTLDGGNTMEVLQVNSGVTFDLNALTIAHGEIAATGPDSDSGGAMTVGSGSTVTITDSTFDNNQATAVSGVAYGGGIINNGTVNIRQTSFVDNASIATGAGGFAEGGAIVNNSQMSISDSVFVNNRATTSSPTFALGGALTNFGTLTITNSTIGENSGGGGIGNQTGTLTLAGSAVIGNTNGGSGGGINNVGGTVNLTGGSTVLLNTADSDGGGINNSGGTVSLTGGSTVLLNTADSDGGGIYNSGGTLSGAVAGQDVIANQPDNVVNG